VGTQGDQGYQGYQGNQGFQGAVGAGTQGNQGNQGFQGYIGNQGFQGATGVGTQGDQGYQGNQGNQGFQGATGTGNQGTQGNQGFQGYIGNQGNQGFQGSTGSQGNQGNQGFQGSIGNQGSQGNQGFQGNTGTTGAQGFPGTVGYQGTQQDITASALTDIGGLIVALAGAGTYIFECHINAMCSTGSQGAQFGVQYSGTTTSVEFNYRINVAANSIQTCRVTTKNTAGITGLTTSAAEGKVYLTGIIIVSDAGNLSIKGLRLSGGGAQHLYIRAGSFVTVMKVA
jgi:hypothetical protein